MTRSPSKTWCEYVPSGPRNAIVGCPVISAGMSSRDASKRGGEASHVCELVLLFYPILKSTVVVICYNVIDIARCEGIELEDPGREMNEEYEF